MVLDIVHLLLRSVSLSLASTTSIVNTNTTNIGYLWSYAESVSMMAWHANEVQTNMQNIGNIKDTNPSNYVTNGLAGMIMAVSAVAHNTYSDVSALTGQFSNLSQTIYNLSTLFCITNTSLYKQFTEHCKYKSV